MSFKSPRSALTVCVILVLVLLFLPGHCYMARRMSGTVVDSETKEPIVGAIVVAHWEVRTGGFTDGNYCLSQLSIQETVTDQSGHFDLKGWGPSYSGCLGYAGFLDGKAPELIIFKPGYDYLAVKNEATSVSASTFAQSSVWDGRTLNIGRVQGGRDAYEDRLRSLDTLLYNLESTSRARDVDKRIPKMKSALNKSLLETEQPGTAR